MKLWAGAAWTKGYEQCMSVHWVSAGSEKEAKQAVLAEASKAWPEWWTQYPYEIQVKPVDDKLVQACANEDLR